MPIVNRLAQAVGRGKPHDLLEQLIDFLPANSNERGVIDQTADAANEVSDVGIVCRHHGRVDQRSCQCAPP